MTDIEGKQDEFERLAASKQPGVIAEFAEFLVHHKRWWLTPIILILMVLGLFIVLTGTSLGPALYMLF